MLQDIFPHIYHSEYRNQAPKDTDILILQKENQLLLGRRENSSLPSGGSPSKEEALSCPLPTFAQIRALYPDTVKDAFYLFSIDDQAYFAAPADHLKEKAPLSWQSVMTLREFEHDFHSFSGAVGWHLASWYTLHQFCGHCGTRTVRSGQERAVVCPDCGHVWYPRISPVVIIAIVDGDRILLTRYNRNGYKRHALVAGFVEIGETFEDAVRREVMEEVGLRVKKIRYIESQPWPFSSSLIAGFRAEVDGDPTVHLNTDGGEELAEAVWIDQRDLEIEDGSISLTWDMIRKFRDGQLSPSP